MTEQIPSEEEWARFRREVRLGQGVSLALNMIMATCAVCLVVWGFPITEPHFRGFMAGVAFDLLILGVINAVHPPRARFRPLRMCDERFAAWRARRKERDND